MPPSSAGNPRVPAWLQGVLDAGYKIYIASSERLLSSLNTRPFGCEAACYVLEDPEHQVFHEAYLLANSLSFRSPDLKMPHWVLIDCALMQTAIVGFMKPVDAIPENVLHYFRSDRYIDFPKLKYIPVTGQIASPSIDGQSLIGFSLFSLARGMTGEKNLGFYTKALGFEVHGHERYPYYFGFAQYDNPALKIHGRFSPQIELYQPMVPMHPLKDMTMIYKNTIDFDPFTLTVEKPVTAGKPDFWLAADDKAAKEEIYRGLRAGKRYFIDPPYKVEKDGKIMLPMIERSSS
jgi:hypothetical protein